MKNAPNDSSSSPALTNVNITSNSASSGGGMYNSSSNPTLTNVNITSNYVSGNGGGMFNKSSSSPALTNVNITSNYARDGGGMYNSSSSPTLTNVNITSNYARDGGGMYNSSSNPTLTNVNITSNYASDNGGGMHNSSNTPTLTNVIIWNNQAGGSTGSTSASIYNVSSNPTISYSLIANSGGSGGADWPFGTDGGNNIDTDPLFIRDGDPSTTPPTEGDYRLRMDSPALDAGNNNADLDGSGTGTTTISDIATDLAGNVRIRNSTIDMGAYEGALCYVKKDASGSDNGTTWTDAWPNLQSALANPHCIEIWVAAGVYYPDEGSGQTDNERTSTFQLANGVAIYGGFAGTETARAERDWETNVTVLSGDIDHETQLDDNKILGIISSTNDIVGNNAYHVVTGSGTDSTAILDGVTINAGQANGSDPNHRGGGMYNNGGSPTLTNVNITSNYASDNGGGMHNTSSNPMLTNVNITSNYAPDGGGMFNSSSSPALTNVVFSSNSANYGGGIFSYSSNPTLTNVTFSSNSASSNGGGMMNDNSSNPTLTNVIIWNNQAGSSTDSTSASIVNDSSTATISYSLIANSGGSGAGWESALGTDDGNNIDTSPLFVMDGDPNTSPPTEGDYRLGVDSPAIDAGNNAADLDGSGADTTTISEITSDLDGNPRLLDIAFVADSGNGTAPIVDMGAYEVQRPPLYVDENSTAPSPNGSSWANAYSKLQDALAAALSGDEIWVAAGVYYPDEGSGQSNNEPTSTFQLANGVVIYGGFAGTETAREERNWESNVTVLSGDIDQNDTDDDNDGIISSTNDIVGSNAYHVVTGSGTDSSAILDGVTINAGQANGGNPNDRGAGMYNNDGSPALTNVNITSNYASDNGGGMHNTSSNPMLTNVNITSNYAPYGGGMFNSLSSPALTNVVFSSNSASNGGGIFSYSSNPTLTNVTFSSNSANANGGGMMNNNSSNPKLINVIIWNNQAGGSTGSTSASIYNSSSTPTISYSLIANSGGSGAGWVSALGTDGGNNIDTSPLFVMSGNPSTSPPTDGDYRLQITSPAIDAGNNSAIGGGITTDLAGNSRFADVTSQTDTGNGSSPVIDMGAYEAGLPDVQSNLSQGQSYDFNNSSIQIDTIGNIDTIAVYRVEQSYPDAPEGIQTGRYWQVDVVDSAGNEASGFSLAVTLPHTLTTPSDARICRYTGSEWDCDNSNTSADATTVTRTGMTAFSPIAVGNAAAPLAVNLASFTADARLDEIRIEWVTVSELDNLGFNLYRAESPEGSLGQTQLNNSLIPGQAPGSGQGSSYEFVDKEVEAGTTYYYWLEDIDVNGNTQRHGPVSITANVPTAVSLQELRSHESPLAMLALLIAILGMAGLVWQRFWPRQSGTTIK